MSKLHAIIPAGGAGTRLWPLSRRNRPKFLLDLEGSGISVLQTTVLRLVPVSSSITVVTGHRNVAEVQRQLQALVDGGRVFQELPIAVLTEPSARNSMAAIGLATYLLGRKYGDDAVVGSFAADHSITRPGVFQTSVRAAIGAAEAGYLTTIGIEPSSPSSAYGYIQPTQQKITEDTVLVKRFVEKPARAAAEKYIKAGYLWNAGMFVMRVSVLRQHLAKIHPEIDRSLATITASWNLLEQQEVLNEQWRTIERISVDHALAEPVAAEGGVATAFMADSGWTDLGDFDSVEAVRPDQVSSPSHVVIDSPGSVVRASSDKAIVLIGIPEAIVVDTGDALLVTTRTQAQRVEEGVVRLESADQGRFL